MLNTDGRHDAIQEFRDAFEFDHLQEGLPRIVAALFHDSANQLLALLPDGPALTRSIHDLWRGKNEAVRFAVRVRTQGVGGQPPATFRGANPVHETAPVHRTIVRAQDRHPDHQPGRPDGPDGPVGAREPRWQGSAEQLDSVRSGGPIDRPGAWFTPVTLPGKDGEPIDTTTYGGMAQQYAERPMLPDMRFGDAGAWPDHDEDRPDESVGRHVMLPNPSIEESEVRTFISDFEAARERPTSGVTFVNDNGPDDTRSITNPPD